MYTLTSWGIGFSPHDRQYQAATAAQNTHLKACKQLFPAFEPMTRGRYALRAAPKGPTGLLSKNLAQVPIIPRPYYLFCIHNMVARPSSLTATQQHTAGTLTMNRLLWSCLARFLWSDLADFLHFGTGALGVLWTSALLFGSVPHVLGTGSSF